MSRERVSVSPANSLARLKPDSRARKAVDSAGHVYVADAAFDNIQIFDRPGNFLLHFGGTGTQPGEFWLPGGVAIDRENHIYVADAYNRRVQIFQYVGGP